jgi:dUTP pyrophosphatase
MKTDGDKLCKDVTQTDSELLKVLLLKGIGKFPTRGSRLAAGYDLYSPICTVVPAKKTHLIPLDIAIRVPDGHYGRIAPRSSLALKNSIDVLGGVIDQDYTGNVGVILINHSDIDFVVNTGDRIAQLIIEKCATPNVVIVEQLEQTARGCGGFGSTGISSTTIAPSIPTTNITTTSEIHSSQPCESETRKRKYPIPTVNPFVR